MGRPKSTCLWCKKNGHETVDCRAMKAANQSQKQQQKGKSQQNSKQQQPKTKDTCKHCGKVGHTKAECFILNPSLKQQPKGKAQQQGGGKTKCTHCHKGGHTVDECFKANPELRSQRGNKQQQELRCSYCQMPDHTVEACYLLHPELRNPFHQSPPPPPQCDWLAHRGDNKESPPPRLRQRIQQAEQLAFDLMPPEVQRHSAVKRIQGWHPAREAYFTLPIYGAAVDRPVKHSQNPFAQSLNKVAYEAFDTSGDTVMCQCGHSEGYECNLEQWVRRAVEMDQPLSFSDQAEEGFARIMREGLVDHGATAMML